jgi:hypothetical protein
MKLIALAVVGFLLSVPQVVFSQGVENFTLEAIGEDSKAQVGSKSLSENPRAFKCDVSACKV